MLLPKRGTIFVNAFQRTWFYNSPPHHSDEMGGEWKGRFSTIIRCRRLKRKITSAQFGSSRFGSGTKTLLTMQSPKLP